MSNYTNSVFDRYPRMNRDGYRQTSNPTPEDGPDDQYNCIAWALGENDRVISNAAGDYYPSTTTRLQLSRELVEICTFYGFEKCESPALEEGYVKIALYGRNDFWKHAARQSPSGKWLSKLGVTGADIEHESPTCVECDAYGTVYCYMRKPLGNATV